FCRDVILLVADLASALAECARVLHHGGHLLLHNTYATADLEAGERSRLFSALGIVASSVDLDAVESAFEPAGFGLVRCAVIASEWQEAWLESGDHKVEQNLLKVARLRRRE